MNVRRFPTAQQVDAWIAEHIRPRDYFADKPEYDQLIAASNHSNTIMKSATLHGVSKGVFQFGHMDGTHLEQVDRTDPLLRAVTTMYLAAESAGLRHLCSHTFGKRPQHLICDPPVVVCHECLPLLDLAIRQLGYRFDHICDLCGSYTKMMTPTMMSGLGYVTIHGHLCRSCSDDQARLALSNADEVVPVGRNLPCACGSGLKYKKCHGKPKGGQ